MLSPRFVKFYKLSISILIFLSLMILVHIFKPAFIFNERGQYREFGLGYKNNTVFPIWLVTIVLAILSYLFVSWYTL
jgi:hypothetical protein